MPNYRRLYVPGGTFFFTIVVHQRRPIFTTDLARSCLQSAIDAVRNKRPFDLVAMVLLPDHWHTIWTLPPGQSDYSLRISQIKQEFTRSYLASGGVEAVMTESRRSKRERAIWQRRFWEHYCRDENDLKRCLDYVHWNPVKHRLVKHVRDWQWSTFQKFVEMGEYELNWGDADPCPGFNVPEWE
jgi:putative transposase